MFRLAKWLDTEYFPETKKAFFKERKNGEIAVCYRGRCWSYLCSWCIFGRGDRYDLSKIFDISNRLYANLLDPNFCLDAKKFIRSPDSKQYLNDVLYVFNRFKGSFVFACFENPAAYSDIRKLSNYFINEPRPLQPEDENFAHYNNLVLADGAKWEKYRCGAFIYFSGLLDGNANPINPKNLITYISRICELSSDWKEASKNLRPTLRYLYTDLSRDQMHFYPSNEGDAIYRIAQALCDLNSKKPSDDFSRSYIDSIFNVERNTTKILSPTNIIDNFNLLPGKKSNSFLEIAFCRITDDNCKVFMEPLTEDHLTLFVDTDSFFQKVNFFRSFFVDKHSFLGCIDQNLDVLRELRTEGDQLGTLKLNIHCLSPRTDSGYEAILINFIRENCSQLTLLEKFEILKLFTFYHSTTFKYPDTLKLVLTFFRNYFGDYIRFKEIKSSILFIVECLKNAKLSNNLLRNLNTENASFRIFLKHFAFSENPLILPLFAASTLPSDLDWNLLIKILTSGMPSDTEFGSSESIKNSFESREIDSINKNFLQHVLDSNSNDLFKNVTIANIDKDITNIMELSYLLFDIGLFNKYYTEELIGAQTVDISPILRTFVENIIAFHDVKPSRIPQSLVQAQALLDSFETEMLIKEKSISNLLVRLVKIPDAYQPLTNELIEKVRSFYFIKEDFLRVNGLKKRYCGLELQHKIRHITIWNDSKILTLLKTMHIGTILGQVLNEDVVFHIVEFFIALRAHEAFENDQIAAGKKSESCESLDDDESESESASF